MGNNYHNNNANSTVYSSMYQNFNPAMHAPNIYDVALQKEKEKKKEE